MPDSTVSDEALVQRVHDGDDRAIDVLLDRYRHFARAKARTYFLAGGDKEDIVQEGMIGLYKSIRDFDAGKETAFRAFAEVCITRQIITAIKAATRQKHIPLNSYVSLNKPLGGDEGEERTFGESLVSTSEIDPAENLMSGEGIAALKESMATALSPLEQKVLQAYVDGRSYQEIADTLGRHVKSIDNALQRIKRKLEGHLADQEASGLSQGD